MLVHLKGSLTSCSVIGKDGTFGNVEDILLDEETWKTRYFTVYPGKLINRERFFLPPELITFMNWIDEEILVNITYERTLKTKKNNAYPMYMDRENDLDLYYRFCPYWTVGTGFGGIQGPTLGGEYPPTNLKATTYIPETEIGQKKQSLLHYGKKLIGYELASGEETFGKVLDLLLDENHFKVCYIIASTKKIMPGKTVLISTDRIKEIDWKKGKLRVDAKRSQIESSPDYMFGRQVTPEMEKEIRDHYN